MFNRLEKTIFRIVCTLAFKVNGDVYFLLPISSCHVM